MGGGVYRRGKEARTLARSFKQYSAASNIVSGLQTMFPRFKHCLGQKNNVWDSQTMFEAAKQQ
jgi:hypothetical protein